MDRRWDAWGRLQLALVGAHYDAAAQIVAALGVVRGLAMCALVTVLHGAAATWLVDAAAESGADSYGALAASCGLGRRALVVVDAASMVVVATACANRLNISAVVAASAVPIEGPPGIIYVCAALAIGAAAALAAKHSRVSGTLCAVGLAGLLVLVVLASRATDVAVETTTHPLRALTSLNLGFALLQPTALSLVTSEDPRALARAAFAGALTAGVLYGFVAATGNSPSTSTLSATVAALSLVPLVRPLRRAAEGLSAEAGGAAALVAVAVVAMVALFDAFVPGDALVALCVGVTSFALPVWSHWRLERPRDLPVGCKTLRFVCLDLAAPACVLFLGVALSLLPAAGLATRLGVS